MFSYGSNIRFSAMEENNGVRFVIENFPSGVNISPADFAKQLEKRKCEGIKIDPNEEIEFVSGIEDGVTTGGKIEYTYKNGDIYSSLIIAGTLCNYILKGKLAVHTWEVGGINTNEKNQEYIKTALQKMVLENGSLGGVVECQLNGIDIDSLKRPFSSLLLELPEVEAIQFSRGVMASKLTTDTYEKDDRILVTFRPDFSRKSPCLAVDKAVVIESILAITAVDMGL